MSHVTDDSEIIKMSQDTDDSEIIKINDMLTKITYSIHDDLLYLHIKDVFCYDGSMCANLINGVKIPKSKCSQHLFNRHNLFYYEWRAIYALISGIKNHKRHKEFIETLTKDSSNNAIYKRYQQCIAETLTSSPSTEQKTGDYFVTKFKKCKIGTIEEFIKI